MDSYLLRIRERDQPLAQLLCPPELTSQEMPMPQSPQHWKQLGRAAELVAQRQVIEENVADADDNTTRFVVLARAGRDIPADNGPVMTTFIFGVISLSRPGCSMRWMVL